MNRKLFTGALPGHRSVLALLVSLTVLGGCSQETPTTSTDTQTKAQASSQAAVPEVREISDADAQRSAKQIMQQVTLTMADGMEASLWASEKLLGDTVAINVDDRGRIWAATTFRSNNSEFDIRGYPTWEQPSMGFQTVEDRREFLHNVLAPEKSSQNKFIPDRNKDGSHDWRDLAVNQEEVILLQDTTGSGMADKAQVFLRDFNNEITDVLGGVFYHSDLDEVFLTVAPDAWRVKDTDGDGIADTKTSLAHGFAVHIGFSGHGLSGITQGPDGRIYYSMGDVGTSVTDQNGKKWHYPNQGVVVRSELDGSGFEVFAAGVRNVHEFAFDKYGNMISVDNDGDHVGEYERLVYLIDGSDSGWRTNWQLGKYRDSKNNTYKVWMDENYYTPRFEDQAAHLLPPIAPYHSGPSGMAYNPGTAFSDKWKEHFFVVEFVGSAPRSGVNAFTLEREGASFKLATDQQVFRGALTTGIDFGPDGALYMSDWIEGWGLKQKGRIWKLDTPESANNEARQDTRERLAESFANHALEQLTQLLRHDDMRVRQKAQFELVKREATAQLQQVATEDEHQLARIHAMWGLGQLARKNADHAAALLPLLEDADSEIRAQAARVLGDSNIDTAADRIIPLLKDSDLRVQLLATQALGRINADAAVQPILAMLEANNDKDVYLRHAGAIALERIGDEEALAALTSHPSEAVRIAAVVALKRLESPAVAGFLKDKSEFIVTNAARAISDDNFITPALPALAQLLDTTSFTNEPLLRRLINANLYAEGTDNVQRLVKFAQKAGVDSKLRAEALYVVGVWNDSSEFDRVTGQHRGKVSHNIEEARQALTASFDQLLGDREAEVREATILAVGSLDIRSVNDALLKALSNDPAPIVRIAALTTLKEQNYSNMGEVVFGALKDKDQSVRLAALAIVPELDLPVAQAVEMHDLLLQNGSTGEQQAAYLSLANVKAPEAYAVFAKQLQKLIDGDIAPEVQLELVSAAEKIDADPVKSLLASYQGSKDQSKPVEIYRESLYGGDAMTGRNIFRYNNAAQCVRCHIVGKRGNLVGPELTNIANLISREELLEAMVDPAARIAPGFGRITAVMKNGERIEGAFDAETKTTMTITAADKTHVINRADVADIETSVSGMPPMGYLLSREEIRDLVAYLSTLKGEFEE